MSDRAEGDAPGPAPDASRPPAGGTIVPDQRPPRRTRRTVALWACVVVVALLVTGVVGGYLKYRAVWDSIRRVAVSDLGKRPPKYTSALNLLVFGSGSVAGLTRHQELAWHVGREEETRSPRRS